ncbi:hypothetical protein [Luteolibacter marinus]|uniref:hypothetical protein n=1 Tax=Luteolibacter marinus TaxID=2776705 RepID=UPI001866294A|nr:hypothetical protein [Luteolibacter marinus]
MPAELIDEQDAARLIDHQQEILDKVHPEDLAARIHADAIAMAAETESYLRECHGHLTDTRAESGRHGKQLLKMIDFQTQLRAHHLDQLERLQLA